MFSVLLTTLAALSVDASPKVELTAQQGKVKRLGTGYAAELIGLDPGNSTIRCGRDDSCEHQGHCADQPQRVDLAHPQLLSYLT